MQDREDVLTCLVTGNLQPIGWAKMEALGIKHLFSEPYFGGFGSDYCNPDNSDQSWKDRAELVKIAAEKAQKHFPGMFQNLTARCHTCKGDNGQYTAVLRRRSVNCLNIWHAGSALS